MSIARNIVGRAIYLFCYGKISFSNTIHVQQVQQVEQTKQLLNYLKQMFHTAFVFIPIRNVYG